MRVSFASVGAGLIASVLAHLFLLIAVAVPHQQQTVHGETLTVDLVSPEEAAPAFKDQPTPETPQPSPQAETQPDWSKLQIPPTPSPDLSQSSSQQAARQSPPQSAQRPPASSQAQQAGQRASAPPGQPPPAQVPPSSPAQTPERPLAPELQTPETLAEQGTRLASMLGLPPPSQSGGEAEASKADVDAGAIAAFKEHLKSCWAPPAVPDAQKTYVLIRAAFRRDGSLAGTPEMFGGSPTGPLLKDAAIQALKRCSPFTMLPQAKYEEWRVLDLTFPPDHVAAK